MQRRYLLFPLALAATPLAAQQARLTPQDSALHVLNRLAYGPTPGLVDRIAREGVMRWVDRQLAVESPDDPGMKDVLAQFDLLHTSPHDLLREHRSEEHTSELQ